MNLFRSHRPGLVDTATLIEIQFETNTELFAHPYFVKIKAQLGFKKFVYADGYLSVEYMGGKSYVIGTIAQQIQIA